MRRPAPTRPRRHALVAVVAVLALGLGAVAATCAGDQPASSGGDPPAEGRADAGDVLAARLAESAAVVTHYVEALADGDVDAAMASRCSGARVAPELAPQFLAAARALSEELGGLEVASVRPSDRPRGPAPPGDPTDLADVLVALDGPDGATGEVLVVTGVEAGERRVCASATEDGDALIPFATEALSDLGATDLSPADLVPPAEEVPGALVDEDGGPVRDEAGAVVGEHYVRAWSRPDGRSVRVTAFRTDDPSRARPDLEAFLAPVAADGVTGFELGDVDGVVGIRHRGEAWLLVQPPDAGPMADRLHLLFGDTFVLVDVSGLAVGDDHGEVERVARAVLGRAGR